MALKPHSGEWFRELARKNPDQAERLRERLEEGGTLEGCTFCGGEPAEEYEDEAHAGRTARLCVDCFAQRGIDYQERWVPLED